MLRLQINFGKKDSFKYKDLVEIFEKLPTTAGIRSDFAKELMYFAIKKGAPLPDGLTLPGKQKDIISSNDRPISKYSNEIRDLV